MASTKLLLLDLSTGVPPKLLKINPKGPLNNESLPIKLILTPDVFLAKIPIGKSCQLV